MKQESFDVSCTIKTKSGKEFTKKGKGTFQACENEADVIKWAAGKFQNVVDAVNEKLQGSAYPTAFNKLKRELLEELSGDVDVTTDNAASELVNAMKAAGVTLSFDAALEMVKAQIAAAGK